MPQIKVENDAIIFGCDCKRIHTITQDKEKNFVIETDESGIDSPKPQKTLWERFIEKREEKKP